MCNGGIQKVPFAACLLDALRGLFEPVVPHVRHAPRKVPPRFFRRKLLSQDLLHLLQAAEEPVVLGQPRNGRLVLGDGVDVEVQPAPVLRQPRRRLRVERQAHGVVPIEVQTSRSGVKCAVEVVAVEQGRGQVGVEPRVRP